MSHIGYRINVHVFSTVLPKVRGQMKNRVACGFFKQSLKQVTKETSILDLHESNPSLYCFHEEGYISIVD